MSGGIPFAPRGPGYNPGTRISDIYLRQGQDQAEAAQRSGQIWGGAVQGLGRIASGALEDYGARQEQKKAADAISKRDAAFMAVLPGLMDGTGDPKAVFSIFGPEKAPKILEGLSAYQKLGQTKGEEALKQLPGLVRGLNAVGEGSRAALYQQIAPTVEAAGLFPSGSIPKDYTPEGWKDISDFVSGMEKPKEAAPKGPMAVNPGQVVIDPETGKPIYTAPEKPTIEQPRVVGRSLVGADGKVIYRDPDAPRAVNKTWVMRPNGEGKLEPAFVAESDVRPGDRPASTREQGRPVISGDAGRLSDLDESLKLAAELGGTMKTGTSARVGAAVPDFVTELTGWGTDAKAQQGKINIVKQIIGKGLEGGVLRKEDELKYEKMLPKIGDAPAVADAKIAELYRVLQEKKGTLVDSLEDGGYDVSRYRQRDAAKSGELPKGTTVPAPKKNPFR